MAAIHIGNNHNSTSSGWGTSRYTVLQVAPVCECDGNGIIQTCYVYWYNLYQAASIWFGTFEYVSSTVWKCRSAAGPLDIQYGSGLKYYYVSLAAKLGDVLGFYWATGTGNSIGRSSSNPLALRRSALNVNGCVAGASTSFPTLITSINIRNDGAGITTGGKLYLGGLASAKRMMPLRGWG